MKAGWILLPALWLGAGAAQARDIYCDMKGFGSTDRVREWFVVNSSVRKPQLPGQTTPNPSCSISFQSLGGMYRPIEIVTKPKLGEAKTSYNRLYYRSSKSGEDFVSIRQYEVGRTGGTESSVFQYRIHVVDKPL
jgi:hypothetical protein